MGWLVRLVLIAAACDAGQKPTATREPPPAVVPRDAPEARGLVTPVKLASDLAYLEAAPFVDGDHAYAGIEGAPHKLRRVPRGGGAEAIIDGDVVHGGVAYALVTPARGITVDLVRLEAGARTVLARIPRAGGGKDFAFDASHMYWTAPTSLGVGPVYMTRLKTGQTTLMFGCRGEHGDECPQIVAGTPPLVYLGREVHRLASGYAKPIANQCPMHDAAGAYQEPVRSLGDHMLCEMRNIGPYESTPTLVKPADTLVPLDGGAARPANGLGEYATRVGEHWYHATSAGLVRRRTLDGPDEVVVAMPAGTPDGWTDSLHADERGLVWSHDGVLWAAPLPP